MNFFQIKAFCAIVDRESFSEAAEDLFVSASCLSKTIKSLESELDIHLFLRERNKVSLTPAGHCFYESAQVFTRQQSLLMQELSRYREDRKNNIRVGLTSSQRYFSLLTPIKEYQKENPGINIAIFELEKDTILKKLDSNEVDLAVSWDDDGRRVSNEDYDIFYFKKERRVLLCSTRHPIADKDCVELKDVRNYPFVLPNNELQLAIYTELCERNGFTPQIGAYYNSINTQFDLVDQNFGLSFILESMADAYPSSTIRTVEFTPPVYNNLAVIRKKSSKSRLIQNFISYYLGFMQNKYGEQEFE